MSLLRTSIIEVMREAATMRGSALVSDIADNTVLLESGLDSLGFAILVARLEEELGYDPFVLMDQPVYPRTLAELIEIYLLFAPTEI
jgi:acyl carrier protein